MNDNNLIVKTAYRKDGAFTYDAERFTTRGGVAFHEIELAQLIKALEYVPDGGHILEVGCGTGRFTHFLGTNGYQVIGIDPSPHMLEVARGKCTDLSNVEFDLGEGQPLPFEDSFFDFVFSIRVTNQTESEEYALLMIQEMIRIVKPNHYVLVEFVNANRSRLHRRKTTQLTFAMIRKMLAQIDTSTEVIWTKGILFISQTLLNTIPSAFVPGAVKLDNILSKLMPGLCSRNYILVRKEG